LKWTLIAVPAALLSFLIGVRWGALGVAICYTICSTGILMVPSLFFACRYSPISVAGFFNAVCRPAAVSLMMYAAVELAQNRFAWHGSIQGMVYSCLVALCVAALGLTCWSTLRDEAMDAIRVLKMR